MSITDKPIEIPINGVLDLHTFQPKEAGSVVKEYLYACYEKGIEAVRIIHGKGIGNLRRTVEACLKKLPIVKQYKIAGADAGHWGATLVTLAKKVNA